VVELVVVGQKQQVTLVVLEEVNHHNILVLVEQVQLIKVLQVVLLLPTMVVVEVVLEKLVILMDKEKVVMA
jgi:hypothetical protein